MCDVCAGVACKAASEDHLARLFRSFPGMEYCDLKRDRASGAGNTGPGVPLQDQTFETLKPSRRLRNEYSILLIIPGVNALECRR